MSTKKKTSYSLKKSKRRQLLITLLLALSVGGFFAVRAFVHHQQTEEAYKRDVVRFAQTENDMAAAYDAIVAKLGKPYEAKISKDCSYGALKFERGPLSCGIGYVFSYETNELKENKDLGATVAKIVRGNYGFSKGNISYGLGDINQAGGYYSIFMNNVNNLGCDLYHYVYISKDFNDFGKNIRDLDRDVKKSYVSVLNLACNKFTPKAVYTIDKSTE